MGTAQSRRAESRYDVVLVSAGPEPRRVAQTIAAYTPRNKAEALELIESAPVLILQGEGYQGEGYASMAEGLRRALERRGATVEVRAYDVETPMASPQSSQSPKPLKAGKIALLIAGILIALAVLGFLSFGAAVGDAFKSMCVDCM